MITQHTAKNPCFPLNNVRIMGEYLGKNAASTKGAFSPKMERRLSTFSCTKKRNTKKFPSPGKCMYRLSFACKCVANKACCASFPGSRK